MTEFQQRIKIYIKKNYYRTKNIKNPLNGFNSTHDSTEHIINEFEHKSIKTFQTEAQIFKNCLKE